MDLEFLEIDVGSDLHRQTQALRDAILRRPLGRPLSAGEMARDAAGRHFAAVRDGRVIGCVGLYPEGGAVVRLRHMAVAEAAQRGGVGAGLVAFAEDAARGAGVTRVETHARCTARGFYAARGYTEEGPEFDEHGIPHVFMWKTL